VQLGAFAIDTHEVTQHDYDLCVAAGTCTATSTGDDCNARREARSSHPANCVDHDQAAAYCTWVGGRLPTEAEWEYAAGGKKGAPMRKYAWGDALPEKQLCWDRCPAPLLAAADTGTCAAGAFPQGNTPTGLSDMAGNVAEWTDTPFCLYSQPGCSGDDGLVVRGGAFCGSDATAVRVAARKAEPPAAQSARIGFRCAHAAQAK
jgi:formylglycine-generating enzyme required for sulfatase activity